ncbi:MAG: hypothetical protein PHV07_10015 [Oscillospiraceae bacterium]|nr:hypothetical protein [Oscillospiraceae bacterium]
MKTKTKQRVWFVILLIGLIAFFATGCRSIEYVPVEYKTIEYKDRYVIDSIYNRDTVQIFTRGDTVYNNVIKWRERFKVDTLTYFKTDSVPVIVEVDKYINQLTKWQRWRLNAFNVLVAGMLVWLLFFFRSKFRF